MTETEPGSDDWNQPAFCGPRPPSRRLIFGTSGAVEVTLSPDGRHIAWLAEDAGTWRPVIGSVEPPATARLVAPQAAGVSRALVWAGHRHLIVFRDTDGDENYRAYAVAVDTGVEHALTPPGARALFGRCHTSLPHLVVFQVNDADPARCDLVGIDVRTGATLWRHENTQGFSRIHVDATLVPRLAENVLPDGSVELLGRAGDGWVPRRRFGIDDVLTSRVIAVSDRRAVLLDSSGRDTAALVLLDLSTGAASWMAIDEDADIEEAVLSPADGRPLAVASCLHQRRWVAVDPGFSPVLEVLQTGAGDGQFDILGIAGDRVLARIDHDDRRACHVTLATGQAAPTPVPMLRNRGPAFAGRRMEAVTLTARDGLLLRSYLTRPNDGPGPWPMMVAVHGGPYDRDRWGYSPIHQWLASRGHAVLSVNYRGSTGFGKAFVGAADREWGGRMVDDLIDAVAWAVDAGIADPARVAIMGNSYGGYAALMAGALHPGAFTHVISIAGPTRLTEFVEAIPPYWRSWFAMIRRRLADPDHPEGRAWLESRSPLTHVRRLRAPVLLVHGQHDVRVAPSHARRMAAALDRAGTPVTLAVFSDEGHFISHRTNLIALAGLAEAFLAAGTARHDDEMAGDLAASSLRIERGGAFLPPDSLALLRQGAVDQP